MFSEFFLFELKFRLKQISTYVFGIVLFLFGFLIVNIIGGAFSGVSVVIMSGGERLFLNSAYVNSSFMDRISIFLIFIVAALIGSMLSRDLEHKAHPLLFTKPINRWSYITGRLSANLLLIITYNLFFLLGMFIAYFMPWLESDYFMKPEILHYLTPLIYMILPNTILISTILLGIFLWTRKSTYLYVASFFILTVYLIGSTYISNIANRVTASLIDPFGYSAMKETTRLWSIAELNSNPLPLSGLLLWNRAGWLLLSIVLLLFCIIKFKPSAIYDNSSGRNRPIKEPSSTSLQKIVPQLTFGFSTIWKQFISLCKFNLKIIFRSLPVYILTLIGIAFMILIVIQYGTVYNTGRLPVTYNIAEALSLSITLLLVVFITLYTGELVWKSRDHNYHYLLDSTSGRNLTFYLAQFCSLALLLVFLFGVFMLSGIIYQTVRGYTDYEISTYLKILFGFNLPQYIILIILSLFIHNLVGNKYTGHFLFIALFILLPFLQYIGINHTLLHFNTTPVVSYSDMNGAGSNLQGYIWFTLYWSLASFFFAWFTIKFWRRGERHTRPDKIRSELFSGKGYLLPVAILFLFTATGGYIFYNTNVLNSYVSPKRAEKLAVEYELTYGKYNNLPQPRITDVNIRVDIYPETRDFYCEGTYIIKNRTEEPIKDIHVTVPQGMKVNALTPGRDSKLLKKDEAFNYYIFSLQEPLLPDETEMLEFNLSLITRGFSLNENQFINRNGTFIHSTYFPSIGYNEQHEISSPRTRERYNLPVKERFRELDDPSGLARNYISNDADWITFEAIISTSADQTALTSGNLAKAWQKEERNYFHYRLDGIMLNYYVILSADYEVKRERWHDIDIEIYHDARHHYNTGHMMNSVKKSLAYMEQEFGPYPHSVLRIAEFPRYGSFAQSLATLIPFSEAIGFIADIRDDKVNYPFAVTAHEVAHQWWAHQVIGANVKGALTLAEALTQYSALKIMEREFSSDVFRDQLRYDLTSYLSGRSTENRIENPVYLDDGQQYIHYSKGAMAFYGLSRYIGEDSLNSALRSFYEDKRYQEPPYTTTSELFEYIEVPDSLQYYFDETFKQITLYDNSIKNAEVTKNEDGNYTLSATLNTRKYYADGLGNREQVNLSDWIEVVVYDEVYAGGRKHSRPIYQEYHLFREEETELELILVNEPTIIGIDPDHTLIDLSPYSNRYRIK